MSWIVANEIEADTDALFDCIGICVTGGLWTLLRHHCDIFTGIFQY